jgi:hypothetical protein
MHNKVAIAIGPLFMGQVPDRYSEIVADSEEDAIKKLAQEIDSYP